jgi:hypothetical protein
VAPELVIKLENTEEETQESCSMASTSTATTTTLPLPERFRNEMENVTLPKPQFLKMVERVKNYETRLQAVRNLQDLLHEKNKDIFFSKRDLKIAENKIKEQDGKIKQLEEKLYSSVHSEAVKQHDSGFGSTVLSPPNSDSGMIDDDHSYTRAECIHCKGSLVTDPISGVHSKSASLPPSSDISIVSRTSLDRSGAVSKEVFDAVVKEYEILKKTVQDLLQTSGTSVKSLVVNRPTRSY